MRPARAWLANAALALASFGLAIAVTEWVCRRLEASAPAGAPVAEYIADWAEWDGEFYTVRTTAAGTPSLPDYNHDGLRDREHAVPKPPGVRRLACVGDSTTMGWGIRPAEAYPQVLQDRLHAAGQPVEVFNVALPGWTTRQERIAYERIARRYKVDRVVLGICLNDIPEMQNNLARPPRLLALLHQRSAMVRRAVRAHERQIADVEELFREPAPPRVSEAWERLFAEIRRLGAALRADGAGLGIVVLPFASQARPDAPPPVPQRVLRAFCVAERIPFLDVLPAIRDAGETAFIDYDHLSPLGASIVADQILASGLVDAEGDPALSVPRIEPAGPDLAGLLPVLRDADPRKRAAAVRAIGTLGAATSPKPLVRMLSDPAPDVRASAAWALGAIGARGDGAAEGLLALLDDEDARARAGAAFALGRIGGGGRGPTMTPAVARLIAALSDTDDVVRWRAADALVQIAPATADATLALRRTVEEKAGAGCAEAARVLGSLGPAAAPAVPSLVLALRDPRVPVRVRVLRALEDIGPAAADAVPAVAGLLADSAVRAEAIDALGGIGPAGASALPALVAAVSDPSPAVRRRAVTALGRIGTAAAAAGPAIARAAADTNGDVRLAALQSLGKVGAEPEVAVPVLVRALEDADPRTRMEAAHALGRMGPNAASTVRRLVPLLGDPDGGVRAAVVRALGRIGSLSNDDRQAVARALEDPDERVRTQAGKALERLPRR